MIWKTARSWVSLLLVGAALFITGVAHGGAQTPVPATPEPGVVREVLSSGDPTGAPGQVLELVRYTIPPNTTLPVHTHPGMQASTVESGTLYYTVVAGEVPLYPAGESDGTTGAMIPITPDRGEVAVHPGDSITEPEGVIHFGRTRSEPVVILVASLLTAGEPPANVVTLQATPAP